ncbi:hypothetical protein [Sulfuricaulis sp.]|jgi:hypothetical protein|uniref:hypothetical protein n=1 Tax=Sulfuricaulis sp. TaxID=2003553 RepID=UPI0035596F7D
MFQETFLFHVFKKLEQGFGAVIELGKLTQTPTPHIDSVYACVKLLAKTLGEEKGKLKIEKLI